MAESIRIIKRPKKDKWYDVLNNMPEANHFGETGYVLCVDMEKELPFVGWYNSNTGQWQVAHHFAHSGKAKVTHWQKLPQLPKY